MITRTVDELGRVIIPCDIREMLGIDAKTKVSVEVSDGAVMIRPVTAGCITRAELTSAFAGMLTAI